MVLQTKEVKKLTVEEAREARISLIKKEAGERITATNWMLERARDRKDLRDENDVLAKREEIRRASDEAESHVKMLDNVEEIKNYAW